QDAGGRGADVTPPRGARPRPPRPEGGGAAAAGTAGGPAAGPEVQASGAASTGAAVPPVGPRRRARPARGRGRRGGRGHGRAGRARRRRRRQRLRAGSGGGRPRGTAAQAPRQRVRGRGLARARCVRRARRGVLPARRDRAVARGEQWSEPPAHRVGGGRRGLGRHWKTMAQAKQRAPRERRASLASFRQQGLLKFNSKGICQPRLGAIPEAAARADAEQSAGSGDG
ncbi:unnamed protein product, partial [Prorocentrum cordatum]